MHPLPAPQAFKRRGQLNKKMLQYILLKDYLAGIWKNS